MECSICHDTEGQFHQLECGHNFHVNCICNWFRRGNESCPNCRHTGFQINALNWPDALSRSREMCRVARKKTAPTRLKRMVEKLRKYEDDFKIARREMMEFKRNNREIFTLLSKIRRKYYVLFRKIREKKREIGTFASPDFPLPNINRPR